MHRTELSQTFGPFQTDTVLGSGQYGTVYSAHRVSDGLVVALKVLDPALADDIEVRRRFVREGYATRRFDHRNVVCCIDAADTDDTRPWIAFELIRGVPLSRLMHEPVDLPRQVGWLQQILSGLRHMHDRGAVHRDIKPANVMVEVDDDGRERVVIVDLGLTQFADLEGNSAAEEGTPSYLAPELIASGMSPSVQSDIYAVGVILFQLLEGRLPYEGSHGVAVALQQVTEPIPKLGDRLVVRERLRWQAVVERALAKDPNHRFSSTDEFRSVLPEVSLDSVGRVDVTGPSDFSIALDEALVSARHVEQTVDRRPPQVNVEQWLYPETWKACTAHLRAYAVKAGKHRVNIEGRDPARTARFVYHLARSLQAEGYFNVVFPEFEHAAETLDSSTFTGGVNREESVQKMPKTGPRLAVIFSDADAEVATDGFSSPKEALQSGGGQLLITVNGEHPESSTFTLDDGAMIVPEHWLIKGLNVEMSLAHALIERGSANQSSILLLLEYLLLTGEAIYRLNKITLSETAQPQAWPNDEIELQIGLSYYMLCADFGSKLADRLLWCGVALGGAWHPSSAVEVLIENGVDHRQIPPLLAMTRWLCTLGPDSVQTPAAVFDHPGARRVLFTHVQKDGRSRSCLNTVLRILLQVSLPTTADMQAIIRCRKLMGESVRATEDAHKFMTTLAARGELSDALRIGEMLDELWDDFCFGMIFALGRFLL